MLLSNQIIIYSSLHHYIVSYHVLEDFPNDESVLVKVDISLRHCLYEDEHLE